VIRHGAWLEALGEMVEQGKVGVNGQLGEDGGIFHIRIDDNEWIGLAENGESRT
jgi:hypothetical protein